MRVNLIRDSQGELHGRETVSRRNMNQGSEVENARKCQEISIFHMMFESSFGWKTLIKIVNCGPFQELEVGLNSHPKELGLSL